MSREVSKSLHLIGGSPRSNEREDSRGVAAMNFQDKIAIVAGGTGALGRAVSLAFFEAGATVMVTYRRKQEFEQLVTATGVEGGAKVELSFREKKEFESLATATGAAWARLGGMPADVTDEADTRRFVESFHSLHGRIDILVNTVGGYAGGNRLWEAEPESYQRMLDLNLRTCFTLTRAVLPFMIRQNSGWIVNIASRAAYVPSPGAAMYAASKAAALALFNSLAEEVRDYNINVNSVVPSIFDTPANREAMPRADHSKWPKPEEIARVVLFLCSEDARIIHGAAIPVYGRA